MQSTKNGHFFREHTAIASGYGNAEEEGDECVPHKAVEISLPGNPRISETAPAVDNVL